MVQFPVVLCIKPPTEFRHNRCKLGTRRVLGCSGGVHSVLGVRSALARRHSEHHRTSGHLQFTRDSNSLGGASEFAGPLGFHSGLVVARHRMAHGSPAVKKDQPTRFMAYAHFRPLQL